MNETRGVLRRMRYLALVLAACTGLAAIDAFLIEPRWLKVSRITITSRKVQDPVRLVLVADVQTDRPGRYEARAFKKVMAERPDLILFAGDYIHLGPRSRSYEAEARALRDLMIEAGLSAPLGVYAVAGNIDRHNGWRVAFDGVPAVLVDATTRYDLGPVALTALGVEHSFRAEAVVPATAAGSDVVNDRFHIVLGHSPNFSLGEVEADLLLAGHTHGGQVQLPLIGPLVTLSAVPRAWASGVTEIAPGKTLIVSRGVGMERGHAPRVRFLCRPEIVVVDLVPEQQ